MEAELPKVELAEALETDEFSRGFLAGLKEDAENGSAEARACTEAITVFSRNLRTSEGAMAGKRPDEVKAQYGLIAGQVRSLSEQLYLYIRSEAFKKERVFTFSGKDGTEHVKSDNDLMGEYYLLKTFEKIFAPFKGKYGLNFLLRFAMKGDRFDMDTMVATRGSESRQVVAEALSWSVESEGRILAHAEVRTA